MALGKFQTALECLENGANSVAKFNKGGFTVTRRTLYTLGSQSMAKLEHRLDPKEAEMLSNMHSNRAVTFFSKKTIRNTQKSIKSPIGNCRCDGEQRYWEHQHRHQ
jgi:hypothetical protein